MNVKSLYFLGLLAFVFSCSEPTDTNSDIPSDPKDITVPEVEINNIQPSATFQKSSKNDSRIVVNLLGLIHPITKEPIELYADYEDGTYNLFVEEDGILQGIKVEKVSTDNTLKADVVFTVDNSGSMGQEADSVALGIIKFAEYLANEGLDVQFGCVGYNGSITGAINLTDEEELEDYLSNRLYYSSGTSRTVGFAGVDSLILVDEAYNNYSKWTSNSGENGVVGVLFADSLFSWRAGAQRVFVNFTDEPTQSSTYYIPQMNTAYMCSKIYGKASVHTVFSADTTYGYWTETYERPWAMSECTGGTQIFLPYDASGLDYQLFRWPEL